MNKYFIYYTYMKAPRGGDGNVEVTIDTPITAMDQIRELESNIKERFGFDSVVVSNYILLD